MTHELYAGLSHARSIVGDGVAANTGAEIIVRADASDLLEVDMPEGPSGQIALTSR